jgi:RND family efflux transporter MFP subunit
MASWNTALATAQSSNSVGDITTADKAAETAFAGIETLLTDVTTALSPYVGTDATSQGLYNAYKGNINAARSTVAADLTTLRGAENGTNSAGAPVGAYDVSLQQAAVANAKAAVDATKTQIAEGTIISPIDGVITEEDVKVGEIASTNAPAVKVISNDNLQIDAYVSETDISNIQVGQKATVTLDGDGSTIISNASATNGTSTLVFPATVVSIDPAETVMNGINSYKVTVQFDEQSPLIKSGMTGNVDFQIAQKMNALAVPTSAIISNNGDQFVLVQGATGALSEVPVTTGIVDPSGWTEITSGLQAGEAVVTFGN